MTNWPSGNCVAFASSRSWSALIADRSCHVAPRSWLVKAAAWRDRLVSHATNREQHGAVLQQYHRAVGFVREEGRRRPDQLLVPRLPWSSERMMTVR